MTDITVITLEDVLKKYKFLQRNKNAFLKRVKIIDDLPEYCTVDGAIAYKKLIELLYDIGRLTNTDVNNIVYKLDYIIEHDNY